MESISELWKWLIGLGTAVIGFFSVRTLRVYDTEMVNMRNKLHASNNEIHKLGLELEQFKTHVAEHYIRRTHK